MGDSKNTSDSISGKLASSFSLYDTFGYFIPGATLVVGFYIFLEIIKYNEELKTKEYFSAISKSWPIIFGGIPILVLFIYVLGHFVASISVVIVDKLLMERTFGYPFQRLFNDILDWKKSDALRYLHRNQQFYKSIIMSLISVAFFWHMKMLLWFSCLVCIAIFLIISKLLFSSLSLKDWRNPDSLRERNHICYRIADGMWRMCYRIILIPFYFPFNTVLYILLYFFRMCKPFEKEFQNKFSTIFTNTFKLTIEEAGTNVYWLTYSYLQQNDKNNVLLIQNWLNMYGFSRNLSIVFLILFLCGLYPERFFENADSAMLNEWRICTGVSMVVFWLRYYYLYYKYYSKYVFRAFFTQRIGDL